MKTTTLRIATTAMLVALATAIVQLIRILSLGTVSALISPMHLPVMLIGLLCGWQLGLLGGVMIPLLNFAISGGVMPAFPTTLVPMLLELPLYGLVMGLSRKYTLNCNSVKLPLLLATIAVTIVVGRIGNAFTSALVLQILGTDSFWLVLIPKLISSAVSSWLGIVLVFVLIPVITKALQHSGILIKYTDDLDTNSMSSEEVEATA